MSEVHSSDKTNLVKSEELLAKVRANDEPLFRRRHIDLRCGFPEIVTLCGSSRFKEEHLAVQAKLTLQGKIVIPMGLFGHHDKNIDMNGPVKVMLDELHLDKIVVCDTVFIVNPLCQVCPLCKTVWYNRIALNCDEKCQCYHELDSLPFNGYYGTSTAREIEFARMMLRNICSLNAL